jgi:acetyltransferase-like isoleucine patch superfamily enzyme
MMPLLVSLKNRVLQHVARFVPGQHSVRPVLHRWRGVDVGQDVYIGMDVLIENEYPERIKIGNGVGIGIRTLILGHFRDTPLKGEYSVVLEDDVLIGPGVIILPNVTVGYGSVVCAGSVVTRSVPPLTMVRGNPAKPIKKCGVPMKRGQPLSVFYENLRPLGEETGPAE